jgi:hypothetical protein
VQLESRRVYLLFFGYAWSWWFLVFEVLLTPEVDALSGFAYESIFAIANFQELIREICSCPGGETSRP